MNPCPGTALGTQLNRPAATAHMLSWEGFEVLIACAYTLGAGIPTPIIPGRHAKNWTSPRAIPIQCFS